MISHKRNLWGFLHAPALPGKPAALLLEQWVICFAGRSALQDVMSSRPQEAAAMQRRESVRGLWGQVHKSSWVLIRSQRALLHERLPTRPAAVWHSSAANGLRASQLSVLQACRGCCCCSNYITSHCENNISWIWTKLDKRTVPLWWFPALCLQLFPSWGSLAAPCCSQSALWYHSQASAPQMPHLYPH